MLRDHSQSGPTMIERAKMFRDRLSVAALVAMTTVMSGCDTPQRDMLDTVSESADKSAWFYYMLLSVCSVILFIVVAWFVYSVVVFRAKDGVEQEMPPQIHGHTQMEIMWTIIPTLIIIGITIPTIKAIFWLASPWEANSADADENNHVVIDVMGKQWWWEYDYISPEDPDRKEIMFSTANEMHVPVGTMVQLRVTSADVIHAFWVPRVSGKRDATPGRTYPLYFKVNEPGEYIGQCAELCGASHALMGIKLFAHSTDPDDPDNYDNWVAAQQKGAQPPTSTIAERGKELFISKGCTACHNIRGDAVTNAIHPRARTRKTGPDLTHVGSRTTIGALAMTNTRDNLKEWILRPQEIKQGSVMYVYGYKLLGIEVNEEEAEAMAAYLFRLK